MLNCLQWVILIITMDDGCHCFTRFIPAVLVRCIWHWLHNFVKCLVVLVPCKIL